jgi:site-specific DNA recombinase
MKRAAIYARNSVDKKDSTTIDDQLRMCRAFAAKCGFEVAREFTDPGISGVAIENRPGFLAMMELAKGRAFDELLLMDMTRFSRNAGDANKQLDLLAWYKVRVHDASKEINSDGDSFRTLIDVDNLVSRLVVKAAAKKSYYNLQGKAERGEAAGGCPYGYRSVVRADGKKWFEIVPEESAVVVRILTMFADGMAGKAIAHVLNSEGVHSPAKHWARKTRRTDGMWHPSAVVGDPKKFTGIIRNEIYVGRVIWNRSTWSKSPEGKRCRTNRPPAEWIRRDAPDLRIIDDVLWQRVQNRIKATQECTAQARKRAVILQAQGLPSRRGRGAYKDPENARAGHPAPYLLSGLLKCAVCGSNFAMANGEKYACASRTNCGSAACSNNQRFLRVDAERLLLADLVQELRGGEYLKHYSANLEREVREQLAAPSPEAALRAQLAEIDLTISNLADAIAAGDSRGSPTLVGRLQAAEETRRGISERLEARSPGQYSGSPALVLRKATEALAQALTELPLHFSDPAIVVEARDALRDWLGDIKIEPSRIGPMARWRLSEGGLLLAAGPRVAKLVAGVGFEPTTFGL